METRNNINPAAEEMIFSYADVFFSCYYNDESGCFHQSRDHALNYVYSGEMMIDDGRKKIHVRKGECVFIRRDHRITTYKKPLDGQQYCGIFMSFTRKFLRENFHRLEANKISEDSLKMKSSVLKLPQTPELESLFSSMVPYFNTTVKPNDDLMQLKLYEGLLALLHIDNRFAPTLFDFTEPWKIDILDFMNQNYMYDFTLEDLANFTGRSLATFKRDFRKISDLTPQKWLIRKRLEVAYELMKQGGKKVQDVYSEVGFKNPSHFSTAFKKQFGIPPTSLQPAG
ncbi:MAG: AraC family transcriptional regulator [Rikenellaceae bacterium]|nr:AraC family transcriptional regulator [Rikenellaceae bacterium]